MKAILEFDLDNPDDRRAHLCAVHSQEMAIGIWEINNNLRKRIESALESMEETNEHTWIDEITTVVYQEVLDCLPEVNVNEMVI